MPLTKFEIMIVYVMVKYSYTISKARAHIRKTLFDEIKRKIPLDERITSVKRDLWLQLLRIEGDDFEGEGRGKNLTIAELKYYTLLLEGYSRRRAKTMLRQGYPIGGRRGSWLKDVWVYHISKIVNPRGIYPGKRKRRGRIFNRDGIIWEMI